MKQTPKKTSGVAHEALSRLACSVRPPLLALAAALLLFCAAPPLHALIDMDFEQPYFVLEGKEIWDFALMEHDSLYHIFYIQRDEGDPLASSLGHATSADLIDWSVHPPAISAGPGAWESHQVWAPHVVRDTAGARWVMAYTGVDSLKIQRPCIAYSTDLFNWTKEPANPIFEPDTLTYFWHPDVAWSSYRDPFLFFEDGAWHMLNTAGLRIGGYPGYRRGILHRISSTDFVHWTDQGVFFEHDGVAKINDLESAFYLQRDSLHHLFFTEYSVGGLSHVWATDPSDFSFTTRTILDSGAAPEILTIDGGDVIGRYVGYLLPLTNSYSFVLRFDPLDWFSSSEPTITIPDPWSEGWSTVSGPITLGTPVFGDNPVQRGDPANEPVGNFYFSSLEYWRGPLAGVGNPGSYVGFDATGVLTSEAHTLEGDRIDLLVAGGNYPTTCYVALLDATTDTILFKETGTGSPLLTPRTWDIRPYRGRSVRVTIVDDETGDQGYIVMDELHEVFDPTAAGSTLPAVQHVTVSPNPFNPRTEFHFVLADAAVARIEVFDPRGRRRWFSDETRLGAGSQSIAWRGVDRDGRPLPSGGYLYRLSLDGRPVGGGRLVLAR